MTVHQISEARANKLDPYGVHYRAQYGDFPHDQWKEVGRCARRLDKINKRVRRLLNETNREGV